MILTKAEHAWRMQKRCFGRAVSVVERFGTDEGLFAYLDEEGASLYGSMPGRTTMRAHAALAAYQAEGG